MKKLLFGALALGLLAACNTTTESTENVTEDLTEVANVSASSRACPSEVIRAELLKNDPAARARYAAIEAGTEKFIQARKAGRVLADGSVEIPVIVNVIYKTAADNVSDARIAEQIATLNADYGATNSDINRIPAEFQTVAAGNTNIKFRLVQTNRKSSTKTSWSLNDDMKKATRGGINATNPTNYLNIWVVNKMTSQGKTILGYATFPESAGTSVDGVVIAAPFFGTTGASAPYNLGRTATHEVGHYLNLRHIWGDAQCGDDFVADTPTQIDSNGGSPAYPLYETCGGVSRSVMFMNYMDYVNDAAMFMFSAGQRVRMQAVVATGGARAGLRVL